MGMVSKITPENESLLPEELRAELGVLPGDSVEWVRQGDGSYRIARMSRGVDFAGTPAARPSATDDSFESLRGIIKIGRPVSDEEIRQAIEEGRASMGGWVDRD